MELTLLHCSTSMKKSGQELKQERNMEAGADKEALEGCCFSACFLRGSSRTSSPGLPPSTTGCALPCQSITSKMPYSRIFWKHFFIWCFPISDDSSMCQVHIRLTNMHIKIFKTNLQKKKLIGWRAGSVIRKTCCSFWEPGIFSQHTHCSQYP